MKLRIWHALGALTLAASATSVTPANAWLKVRNGTSHTLFVTHAAKDLDDGFFSACDFTGCGESHWLIHGWWNIAPGGTATVFGGTFHNFFQKYHAEDDFGHRWVGSTTFCTPFSAFSMCDDVGCSGIPRPGYRNLNSTACCGFLCSGPDDYTLNLTL